MALHLPCSPLTQVLTHNLPRYHLKCVQYGAPVSQEKKGSAVSTRISQRPECSRRSATYKPTSWSYSFLQSLQINHDEKYKNRVKKLEEEVRGMINNKNSELLTTLQLIDDIQHLGLGYHFEKEIRRALDRIILREEEYDVKAEKKLHATALKFRLLRQHGYKISQDVFKTFTDGKTNYMACLGEDVEGILNLYEASFLGVKGENLLEEAKGFSRAHLQALEGKVDPIILQLVSHALELPLHHRMSRLEARWYIEAYDKRKGKNYLLLELAKMDFNLVQSIYQTDLKDMSRWWEEIDLANKLYFVRDRLMECFFWTVGMAPEPQFSNWRRGLTKVTAFITIVDDIYDVHGTLDELELFTEAVERWDINSLNELPDYMQLCFMALYNTVNEMAYDTLKEKGENILPYLRKAWADMCKAFLQEAKWSHDKFTPSFEDYLENGWRSISGTVILNHSYFLLNQTITKEALESLQKYDNLLRWPSMIFRLCNDFGTSKAELERGETAGSILCYMQDTGLSEELAREKIRNLIDESWKEMNKDGDDKYPLFPEPFVETALNLARTAQCQYQYGDAHGAPDVRAKKRVLSLLIDPIPLIERERHATSRFSRKTSNF